MSTGFARFGARSALPLVIAACAAVVPANPASAQAAPPSVQPAPRSSTDEAFRRAVRDAQAAREALARAEAARDAAVRGAAEAIAQIDARHAPQIERQKAALEAARDTLQRIATEGASQAEQDLLVRRASAELRSAELQAEITRLESDIGSATRARDALSADLEALRAELARAEAAVAELRARRSSITPAVGTRESLQAIEEEVLALRALERQIVAALSASSGGDLGGLAATLRRSRELLEGTGPFVFCERRRERLLGYVVLGLTILEESTGGAENGGEAEITLGALIPAERARDPGRLDATDCSGPDPVAAALAGALDRRLEGANQRMASIKEQIRRQDHAREEAVARIAALRDKLQATQVEAERAAVEVQDIASALRRASEAAVTERRDRLIAAAARVETATRALATAEAARLADLAADPAASAAESAKREVEAAAKRLEAATEAEAKARGAIADGLAMAYAERFLRVSARTVTRSSSGEQVVCLEAANRGSLAVRLIRFDPPLAGGDPVVPVVVSSGRRIEGLAPGRTWRQPVETCRSAAAPSDSPTEPGEGAPTNPDMPLPSVSAVELARPGTLRRVSGMWSYAAEPHDVVFRAELRQGAQEALAERGEVDASATPAAVSEPHGAAAVAGGNPLLAEVQEALQAHGFDPGAPDGLLGPRTLEAIRSFQASLGQEVTGELTEAQRRQLLGSAR